MIAVVVADPAGLAVAHELQQCGRSFRVLERHEVGESWRTHDDRLHRHTPKGVAHFPGQPMPGAYPCFPSALQFRDYLARYAREQRLIVQVWVTVRHAAYRDTSGWCLTQSHGVEEAATLVVATGLRSTPHRAHIPTEEVFGRKLLHASKYRNAAPFGGKRVLVIGVGNSGSEIAVDLAECGVDTAIAIRGGVAFGPRPASPTGMRADAWLLRTLPRPVAGRLLRRRDFGARGHRHPTDSPLDHVPVVGYGLPNAIAAGRIWHYGRIARCTPGAVEFDAARVFACDAVTLGKAYRPTNSFVAHALDCDHAGPPRFGPKGRAIGNPYLNCVGFWYPTTPGRLRAIGRVARTPACSIARRTR